VNIAPRRVGHPAVLIGAFDRAQATLGWEPVRSDLQIQIRDAWNWMRGAVRPAKTQYPSLSVIVAWTPSVGIGCPIALAAPRPVGSIERRTRIAAWTTSRAVSLSAFFGHAIIPCCALAN
jgi:hypothetical protein